MSAFLSKVADFNGLKVEAAGTEKTLELYTTDRRLPLSASRYVCRKGAWFYSSIPTSGIRSAADIAGIGSRVWEMFN